MGKGARSQYYLDDERCFELLNYKGSGQIAFTQDAIPIIARLNFQVDNSMVYFQAPTSAPLHHCFAQSVVALYADSIDPTTRVGWSVLVVGRSKIARAVRSTPNSHWAREHLENQLSEIRLVQMSADLIRASYFDSDSDSVICEYENYPFEAPSMAKPVGQVSKHPKTDSRLVAQLPVLRRLE